MANQQQIEDRIDRQAAGAIAVKGNGATSFAMVPTNMGELMEFAKMMSVSGECIPPVFRNKPGACLAVAMQAFRTGFDPFAVANKAFMVNDRIAYESQYIHSLLNTSGRLQKRLRPFYDGEGPSRRCAVTGMIIGEDEPFEYASPTIGAIPVKNSPLWKTDPDQQLFYYASRAWGRRYLPEVLLGIMSPDELPEMIDVTPPPRPQRGDYEKPTVVEHETPYRFTDFDGEVREFDHPVSATQAAGDLLAEGARRGLVGLDAAWENIAPLIETLCAGPPAAITYAAGLRDAYEAHKAELPVTGEAADASGDAAGGGSPLPPVSLERVGPPRHRRTKAEMEAARAAEAKPPKTADEACTLIEKAGDLGLGADQWSLMNIGNETIEALMADGRVELNDEGRVVAIKPSSEPAEEDEPPVSESKPDDPIAAIDAEFRAAAAKGKRDLDTFTLRKLPDLPPAAREVIRSRRAEYLAIAAEVKP